MTDTFAIRRSELGNLVREPAFAQLEEDLNAFCPFDATGSSMAELRHSNYLAYLCKPYVPHGFGEQTLRAVLLSIAEKCASYEYSLFSPLDVHLARLDDAIIDRELYRIDLLIRLPAEKTVIAVELKIGASEHSDQLSRYKQKIGEICKDWKQVFVFLTLDGSEPESANDVEWIAMRYFDLVEELERVAKKRNVSDLSTATLFAYTALIRRMTVYSSDEEKSKLHNLAAELWRKHESILNFLIENQPTARKAPYIQALVENPKRVENDASPNGFRLEYEDLRINTFLRFGVIEFDEIRGARTGKTWSPEKSKRIMTVEIKFERDGSLRVGIVLGRSASPYRDLWIAAMRKVFGDMRKNVSWVASEQLISSNEIAQSDISDEAAIDVLEIALSKMKSFLNTKLPKALGALQEAQQTWPANPTSTDEMAQR